MRTHEQIVKALMQRPGVRAEVERITRDESELLDSLLKARQEAGLSQADVAERMGTQATGKHSPSVATLRKYVKACGKRLVLQVA
jgi:ribosome-binding protein aMBF1 (putative translation factor)